MIYRFIYFQLIHRALYFSHQKHTAKVYSNLNLSTDFPAMFTPLYRPIVRWCCTQFDFSQAFDPLEHEATWIIMLPNVASKFCDCIHYSPRFWTLKCKFISNSICIHYCTRSSLILTHFFNNEHKFVFTKTITLLALNFYEVIVNSGFGLVNYHLTEISNS